ncbi:uncharacterized protein LOC125494807 [Beta vulgaris subsp. vulgaris]|uniref:uncharacterized protein LOC125494807 n=1 Tax=Beta vulgaris subsp. vulgaris TaxID=3555 RepID=UPI002037536E|nr:uncharacterized protein LOC125494807 [Beta vulgaris subsp. vulgaris]
MREMQKELLGLRNKAEERSYNSYDRQPRKEEEMKLSELPEFDGTLEPDVYLDWERRMQRIFDHKNVSDATSFSYATLKFTRYASLWFENMQVRREREGKESISTWSDLKLKLKKRFVPRTYKQDLFVKFNSLQQNQLTVAQYVQEFERLSMACDCKDEDEQKSAKFLIGLNTPIANLVELQVYHSFDELCQLATKVERQQKEAKGKSTRFPFTPKTENYSSFVKSEALDKGKGGEEEFKTPTNATAGQKGMRERVCFKCQGQGHLAKQCPNRMLITLEERLALLTQQMEEKSGERSREDERNPEATLHDMADPSFWAATPIYEPEDKRGLIVRRTLVAAPLEDATHEQRENILESRCLINGKVYNFIIDSGSCTNVVARALVDSLELLTQDHLKPHKLSWLSDDGGVRVKKRALVGFRVGGYMDQMWFDVVPMTACSLLLRRLWQYDRQVLHHGRDNVYSLLVDGARVGLKPLSPKRSLLPMPKDSASSVQDGGGHVCLQNCREEML